MAGWLAGWLDDWLAGWLAGWLGCWLVGWLATGILATRQVEGKMSLQGGRKHTIYMIPIPISPNLPTYQFSILESIARL